MQAAGYAHMHGDGDGPTICIVRWFARDIASLGSDAAHLCCDLRQQHTPHALDGRLNLFNQDTIQQRQQALRHGLDERTIPIA